MLGGGQGGHFDFGGTPPNLGGGTLLEFHLFGIFKNINKVYPQNHAESTQLAELRRLAKEKLKKKFCKSTYRRPRFSQYTNAFALFQN